MFHPMAKYKYVAPSLRDVGKDGEYGREPVENGALLHDNI
jgi:hypothetical protein